MFLNNEQIFKILLIFGKNSGKTPLDDPFSIYIHFTE